MWHLVLKVALGWCALSVLLVLLWAALRERALHAAAGKGGGLRGPPGAHDSNPTQSGMRP